MRYYRYKIRLSPPALESLTEVDLSTSLLSRVPVSGWLPCLATRFRLLDEQVLGWTMEGSSMDQVRGSSKVPGLLGILTNLFPSNNPSKSYPLLVTHASI